MAAGNVKVAVADVVFDAMIFPVRGNPLLWHPKTRVSTIDKLYSIHVYDQQHSVRGDNFAGIKYIGSD